MYGRARTRKDKVNVDVFHPEKESRTKLEKHLWTTFILSIVLVQANATRIDFDDVETLWLKNIAVHVLPVGNAHSSIPSLKITGLTLTDIEDGIQIKPTFSASSCSGNETELPIIDAAAPPSIISDLIVSLNNFHFKQHSAAYLCIKTKYDQNFQHMGNNSKFLK